MLLRNFLNKLDDFTTDELRSVLSRTSDLLVRRCKEMEADVMRAARYEGILRQINEESDLSNPNSDSVARLMQVYKHVTRGLNGL